MHQAGLAELALKNIHDGVMITDFGGVVELVNPAGVAMLGLNSEDQAMGLDYGLLLHLLTREGNDLSDAENPLMHAMRVGQPLDKFQGCMRVGSTDKTIPIALTMIPADDGSRIITFRDITQQLEEESEQAEFISTASHEMRTPVATIDGYLMLCLNPQTATVDERARGYLTAAEKASKHLGKLFQDLLDVTRLDDGRVRPHLTPVDLTGLVRAIAADFNDRAAAEDLEFVFGTAEDTDLTTTHRLDQVVYGFVDKDFMREIMDNLIENAIKYTPEGGSIYVNVRGDGDRALINVTDTGIGISSEDLTHIFQKFYRVDNSDTRTIGGTGLGLYMVKQRVEAMGGKVWAESAFGEGSTFYVSLPRISSDEYEKRMIVVRNEEIQEQLKARQDQAAVAAYVEKNPLPGTAGTVVAAFANGDSVVADGLSAMVGGGGGVAAATAEPAMPAPAVIEPVAPAPEPVPAAPQPTPVAETPETIPAAAEPAPVADSSAQISPQSPEVAELPTELPPEGTPVSIQSAPSETVSIPVNASEDNAPKPVWTISHEDTAPPGPPAAPPESPPLSIPIQTPQATTNNLNGEQQ